MSFFNGARDVQISGGSFRAVVNHGFTGLQWLGQHISAGSIHDSAERSFSGPPARCMPGTRKSTLDVIHRWLDDLSAPSKILWLSGAAGAGKSAVAQTICEGLKQDNRFVEVDFFFSRTSTGRNNAAFLFITLCYQLAIAIPLLRQCIEVILKDNPTLVTKTSDIQLQKLIIEPLLSIAIEARPRNCVIIIDGLDECENEATQRRLIQEFISAYQNIDFPIRLIITSRPDPWIRENFKKGGPLIYAITLEHTDEANDDIRAYFLNGFEEIRQRTPSTHGQDTGWPSKNQINLLVYRASGQFIYAATVLKFCGDPDFSPPEQLRLILSTPQHASSPRNPLAELDALYLQIMASVPDKQRTLDVLGALIAVLNVTSGKSGGVSLLAKLPASSFNGGELLDIVEDLLPIAPGASYIALRRLHALVRVPEYAETSRNAPSDPSVTANPDLGRLIKFHHQTFPEFLVDPKRSEGYWISLRVAHESMGISAMNLLSDCALEMTGLENISRAHILRAYCHDYWSYHVAACEELSPTLRSTLTAFDLSHFVLPSQINADDNRWAKKILKRVPSLLRLYTSPAAREDSLRKIRNLTDLENILETDLEYTSSSAISDFTSWLLTRPHSEVPRSLKERFCVLDNILLYAGWEPSKSVETKPRTKDYWSGVRKGIREGRWEALQLPAWHYLTTSGFETARPPL